MTPARPSIAPHVSLATIMDLLLDAVCVVDAEGRYLFVSAGYERIFGYRPDEVVGTRMIDKVHPDDRERTLRAAQNIMAGHAQPHFQNRYVHKDGHVIDVQWSARWSEEEGVRIAVGHDITELKRAESMQGALLAISEAAHADVDLSTLFGHIHHVVEGLLPAANFFVALRNPADGSVEFPYFIDEHDPAPAPMPLTAPTLTNAVIRSGRALLITPDNTPDLPVDLQQVIGHESVDWLGVPLSVATGVIGALVVQSYTGNVQVFVGRHATARICVDAGRRRRRTQSRPLHARAHGRARFVDRPAQPVPVRREARGGDAEPPRTANCRWDCCTWTWTDSNRSTTAMDMHRATCCCNRPRIGSVAACASRTRSHAWGATNSSRSCTA